MKKNNMLRIASVLLVAVLLSTCAISGAFAKYVTSGSTSDNARVAAFGITVTEADATGLFVAEKTVVTNDGENDVTTYYVKAAEDVVAPGMSGSLNNALEITDSGREVAIKASITADLALANWEVDGAYYCPIVITVGTTPISGLDYASAAEFEAAVENALNVAEALYQPTESFTQTVANVEWAWAFTNGNDEDTINSNNEKDTALGNAATKATIALTIAVNVAQAEAN